VRFAALFLWVPLSACIRDVPLGPDLGDCAEAPEGRYGYGEAGIGRCLAGPADLAFFQQDGATLLAVSNADPFRSFLTGSVLVLDFGALAERLDARSAPLRIDMASVTSWALPIFDDDDGDGVGGNPYLGGIGYLAEQQALLVTSRLTEDSNLRSGRDDVWLVDLTQLEQPGGGLSLMGSLVLEDDPFPVVVDAAEERLFVGNLTDHSVSVLQSAAPGEDNLPVSVVDVAPGAAITPGVFDDADGSGTLAELGTLAVVDVETTPTDHWTLTYIDGTVRALVPTDDDPVVGIASWDSTGAEYRPSAIGIEEGLSDVRDPFVDLIEGFAALYFASPNGDIRRADAGTLAGVWSLRDEPLLSGALRSSPAASLLPESAGLWFDVRDAPGEAARIGLASTLDGINYQVEGDVLVPVGGESYEDPFVAFDPRAQRWRMWLTLHMPASGRYTIGLSESEDGRSWTEPVEVFADPTLEAAAPAVTFSEGRYIMVLAVGDGVTWDHAQATSFDGLTWSPADVVIPGQLPMATEPQRVGIQLDSIGAWRIEGRDIGPFQSLLPASAGGPVDFGGFEVSLTHGHAFPNGRVANRRAAVGLVPGSVIDFAGRPLLFATTIGASGRERMVIMEPGGEDWQTLVEPDEHDGVPGLEEMLEITPAQRGFSPVVTTDDQGLVMFYALRRQENTRIHRAVSTDGLSWTPDGAQVLDDDPDELWDNVNRTPHSIEVLDDGEVRLWYTGTDGSRSRIGSAVGPMRGPLQRELGIGQPFRMGTGLPGSFDDSSVKDPLAFSLDGQTHLIYAGFDGGAWHLGHAVLRDSGAFARRVSATTDLSVSAMDGAVRSFSAFGVESPVLLDGESDPLRLLYAGNDGEAHRVGEAVLYRSGPESVFATQRIPTAGDVLSFDTERGGPGDRVIELGQLVDEFATAGVGMSGMALDSDRGFLYITSKLDNEIFVVDIRDDSSGDFVDANYLDLEGVLRIETGSARPGFRAAQIAPSRSLMYLTMLRPDGVVVVDLPRVVDNDVKDSQELVAVAVLPLPPASRDEGETTLSLIGGAGMALTPDERMLLVTHFRANGVSVVDLDQGAWGQEVAWIPDIGEEPHVVRISPDGRWAVVANYVGELEDNFTSATLAVIDLDPTSEGYLEVAAWLVNR